MGANKVNDTGATRLSQIATNLSTVEQILSVVHGQKHTQSELENTPGSARTPTEKKLVEIWVEVLGVEQIGIYDDFFDIGGHSLLATQILSRMQDTFQVEIPLNEVFTVNDFTVAELAKVIEQYQIEQASEEEITTALDELSDLSDEEVKSLLADAAAVGPGSRTAEDHRT